MRLFKYFISILRVYFLPIIFLLLLSSSLLAKDLTGRLGVGFLNEFSTPTSRQIPALSVKYGLTRDINWLAAAGFNTTDPSAVVIGTKIFKNIFYENYLNFYGALGFGYIKQSNSYVEFLGVFGAEFFIPGLDSLGLSFEAGASASNVSDSFQIKTIGFTFFNAGMHFYF